MKKFFSFVCAFALVIVFVAACGDEEDGRPPIKIDAPAGCIWQVDRNGDYDCIVPATADAGIADAGAVQPDAGRSECTPGSYRVCGSNVGECKRGVEYCLSNGYWPNNYCLDDIAPTPEVCDGKDNDCDGLTDEGNVCPSQPPDAGTPDSGAPPRTWAELEVVLPSAPIGYKFVDLRSNLGCPSGNCWSEEPTPPATYNVACNGKEREFNVAYDPIGGGKRIYLCDYFQGCDKEPVLRGLPYVRDKSTGKLLKVNCRMDASQSDPAKGKCVGDIFVNPCE